MKRETGNGKRETRNRKKLSTDYYKLHTVNWILHTVNCILKTAMKNKQKPNLTLLITAIVLFVIGIVYIIPITNRGEVISQNIILDDWAYGSAGKLNLSLSYPERLRQNQKNQISLTFSPDEALQSNLVNGYNLDTELVADDAVLSPQKRQIVPLESTENKIFWELIPLTKSALNASLSLALSSNALDGTYAISPQTTLELPFEVISSNGLPPMTSFYLGLAMVLIAIVLIVVFILRNKDRIGAKG